MRLRPPLPRGLQAPGADLPAGLPPSLPGRRQIERLANGLVVCVLENRQAPVVTSALFFRAGTRDEPAGHGGIAHFLEHMMFKGSAGYGPGEIDRRTQALGGSNNAFTSHDATAYYFNFASDRWSEALAIEADRLTRLTLDPEQVASERQVILEEIAMYDSEPWDALELAVQARLYGVHPYGRPVLGTRAELLATEGAVLRDFQRRFYRPDNAVLVVAGDVGGEALAEVERKLGGLEPGSDPQPAPPPPAWPSSLERLTRHKGEVPRVMLALPGPAGADPDHAAVELLADLLGGGRTSRLHRALVDEQQLCVWVAAEPSANVAAGHINIALEVLPGADLLRVEAELLRHLEDLVHTPPGAEEVERTRQVAIADWVFGHERVHEQALSLGHALSLFDAGHLDRHLQQLRETDAAKLHEVAVRYLQPARGGVLGWSLPRGEQPE